MHAFSAFLNSGYLSSFCYQAAWEACIWPILSHSDLFLPWSGSQMVGSMPAGAMWRSSRSSLRELVSWCCLTKGIWTVHCSNVTQSRLSELRRPWSELSQLLMRLYRWRFVNRQPPSSGRQVRQHSLPSCFVVGVLALLRLLPSLVLGQRAPWGVSSGLQPWPRSLSTTSTHLLAASPTSLWASCHLPNQQKLAETDPGSWWPTMLASSTANIEDNMTHLRTQRCRWIGASACFVVSNLLSMVSELCRLVS